MSPKESSVKNHVMASIVSIVAVTVMTVYAEINEVFKNWLKSVFSHHWVGKGIIALVIFFVFAHLIKLESKRETVYLVNLLVAVAVLCSGALLLFFIWEAVQ